MRTLLVILTAVTCLSCGSSSDSPSAPATGTAKYVRDANTCNGSGAVSFDFFLDGTLLGSAALTAGQAQSYSVTVGQHTFSARVTNTSATFTPTTGTVAAGGVFTYTMVC